MKTTEPYSPRPRASARAKPAKQGRQHAGQDHAAEGRQASGAQAGRRLFDLGIEVFQGRLQRPHHERQADEHQRHPHAQPRVGDFNPQRQQPAADPAVVPYSDVSTIPETAVGRAKGRSTIASRNFRPGNE